MMIIMMLSVCMLQTIGGYYNKPLQRNNNLMCDDHNDGDGIDAVPYIE